MPIPPAPPALAAGAHKGDAGRLLCLAGSRSMPGAALLVVRAAQRAGAGLVTLGCFDPELARVLPAASPETLYLDLSHAGELFAARLPRAVTAHRHDVRVVGPGLGDSARTRALVQCLVADRSFQGPLVLDADALNVVSGRPEYLAQREGPLVVTPHPGEASRLLGRAVPSDPESRREAARSIARRARAICVLKGAGSVISDGERERVGETGGPALATAGAGDVLCGILGAYLAAVQGERFSVFEAVCSAVHVHGLAGDLGQAELGVRGLVASDLVDLLPRAQLQHAREAAG